VWNHGIGEHIMAVTINADNGVSSGSAGLKSSADSTGVLALQTNGTTAATVGTDQNITLNATGALTLNVGTTAQRPSSPVVGMIRYNTTTSFYEMYTASGWAFITSSLYNYSVQYLVVAGAGGGGAGHGGGGGAGGLLSGTASLALGTTYTVTVGAGGAGGIYGSPGGVSSANGTNSVFSSATAIGGGYGGGENMPSYVNRVGNSGGSGGGGANSTQGTSAGGAGTSGQGFAGGSGGGGANWAGGGGGGASAVGANNPKNDTGGDGGAGSASSIT